VEESRIPVGHHVRVLHRLTRRGRTGPVPPERRQVLEVVVEVLLALLLFHPGGPHGGQEHGRVMAVDHAGRLWVDLAGGPWQRRIGVLALEQQWP
jgi:hypothetical protein